MPKLEPVAQKNEPGYPPRRGRKGLRRGIIAAAAVAVALGACGIAAAVSRISGVPSTPDGYVRMPGEAPVAIDDQKPWEPDLAWAIQQWHELGAAKPPAPLPPPEPVRFAGEVIAPHLP